MAGTTHTKRTKVVFDLDVVKAYHEIGHAIAAVDANVTLKFVAMSIDISLEPGMEGAVGGGAFMERTDMAKVPEELDDAWRRTLTKEVYILIAGSAVDALLKGGKSTKVTGKPIPEDFINSLFGVYDDLEHVIDRMRRLVSGRGHRGQYVKQAYVRVTWWLSKNWLVVESLAERLMKERKISGDDVATHMGNLNCTNMYDTQGNVLDLGVSALLAASAANRP